MKHSLHVKEFAKRLKEAVYQIGLKEDKNLSIVQDELGYALGKSGGSMIEYWRKGKAIPSKSHDKENLTRQIFERASFDRSWFARFLEIIDYFDADGLLNELFPVAPQAVENSPIKLNGSYKNGHAASANSSEDKHLESLSLPSTELPDPAPLPAGSVMPFGRNPVFVGREQELLDLASALQVTQAMAISQVDTAATTGLGGMGKTQLACEFVHRFGQYFEGGVYWLSFDNPEGIPAEIAMCGGAGGMDLSRDFAQRSLNEQTALVTAAWHQPTPRLLIFDNCEDPELLIKWRPKYGGCRILITSRKRNWERILGVKSLALSTLARQESIDLLDDLCEIPEEELANDIADELGDLPLALHLAGYYLRQYKRSVDPRTYLAQLRDPKLLHHPSFQDGGISPTGHEQNVWRTFAMSYDLLDMADELDQLARRLLVHIAHFAPGKPIWYDLLVATLRLEEKRLQEVEAAFNRLLDVGLIETEEDATLRMHRLVAQFVRDSAADDYQEVQQTIEETVYAHTLQVNKEVQPMPLLAWQLHLRSVADLSTLRQDAESARLCNELGKHLWQISDFPGALLYTEKGLEIRMKLFGEQHAETAESLVMVGRVLRALGRLEVSKSYFERSLEVRKEIFGMESVETAESLENVGRAFGDLGNIQLGQKFTKKALDIIKHLNNSPAELLAEYQNNLAYFSYVLKEFEDCKFYLKEALQINVSWLGPNHPNTALSAFNLGVVLRDVGEIEQSLTYLDQSLKIRETAYGADHIDTTYSLLNKGKALALLNRYEEARFLIDQAVGKLEILLGSHHVETANGYLIKGQLMQQRGEYKKAEEFILKAIEIRSNLLGSEHHLTMEAIQVSEKLKSLV